MSEQENKKLQLLVVIVDIGQEETVTELLNKHGCRVNLSCRGRGTAKSEILNMLGLGGKAKDVVLSVIRQDAREDIFRRLKRKLLLDRPGNGIAFTLDIGSVCGAKTLEFLSGITEGRTA